LNQVVLEVKDLVKHFPVTKGIVFKKNIARVRAVDGINFQIEKGKTLGLVGESGSGKTTTGKLIIRLIDPTSGSIEFEGADITRASGTQLNDFRKRTAIVFQDPYSSLDPRKKISQIVSEPMEIHGWRDRIARTERVRELLEKVGLREEDADRYPHQFSGGQRQRIAIARALALSPDLIVADEPISALDVSVQAKIINLLMDIQEELQISYLLVAHDLSIVRHISDRVAVMYLGKIIECGSAQDVFNSPMHPYTEALLLSVPVPNPAFMKNRKSHSIPGEIPSPIEPPSGCHFRPRCKYAQPICQERGPELKGVSGDHLAACYYPRAA
jgi:oligopeptide/dipeptide ABC transporter ATP-binding protein